MSLLCEDIPDQWSAHAAQMPQHAQALHPDRLIEYRKQSGEQYRPPHPGGNFQNHQARNNESSPVGIMSWRLNHVSVFAVQIDVLSLIGGRDRGNGNVGLDVDRISQPPSMVEIDLCACLVVWLRIPKPSIDADDDVSTD